MRIRWAVPRGKEAKSRHGKGRGKTVYVLSSQGNIIRFGIDYVRGFIFGIEKGGGGYFKKGKKDGRRIEEEMRSCLGRQ